MPYFDRRKKLKVPTLKYRRNGGDTIDVFKTVQGYYQSTKKCGLSLYSGFVTIGNGYKLNHGLFKHDLRKYHFNRIVTLLNSLPNHVVEVDSVNTFKGSLDKFWICRDVLYDWEADIKTGTGVLINNVFTI